MEARRVEWEIANASRPIWRRWPPWHDWESSCYAQWLRDDNSVALEIAIRNHTVQTTETAANYTLVQGKWRCALIIYRNLMPYPTFCFRDYWELFRDWPRVGYDNALIYALNSSKNSRWQLVAARQALKDINDRGKIAREMEKWLPLDLGRIVGEYCASTKI